MSELYYAEQQKIVGCGGKKALVVGVDGYQVFKQLNLAVLDAQHVYNALKMAHFYVDPVVKNPTKQELWNAINEFAEKLEHGDIALFYFAGHGSEHNSINYLYGIDGRIDSKEGISYPFGLELNRHVMTLLKQKEANCYFLIIIDACRSKLQTFEAGSSRGQEVVDGSMGFPSQIGFDEYDIVYACQPGSKSLEPGQRGFKKPGYFAQALYSCIMEDGSWSEVITNIKAKVTNLSAGRQKPQNLNNLLATLYLQPTQKQYKSIRAADLNTHKTQETQTDDNDLLKFVNFWNQNYLDSRYYRLLVIFLVLTIQSKFQNNYLALVSFSAILFILFIRFKKVFPGKRMVRLAWVFLMGLVIMLVFQYQIQEFMLDFQQQQQQPLHIQYQNQELDGLENIIFGYIILFCCALYCFVVYMA